MSEGEQRDSSSFGVFLIVTALAFLAFSSDIGRVGFSGEHDPGPKAFPIGLGLCLLVGGVLLLAVGLVRRGLGRPLFVIASLAVYLVVLPRLGFTISTFALATALMTWLRFTTPPATPIAAPPRWGRHWWLQLAWSAAVSALLSAALVAAIQVLFVRLFKVQLPSGEWSRLAPWQPAVSQAVGCLRWMGESC